MTLTKQPGNNSNPSSYRPFSSVQGMLFWILGLPYTILQLLRSMHTSMASALEASTTLVPPAVPAGTYHHPTLHHLQQLQPHR